MIRLPGRAGNHCITGDFDTTDERCQIGIDFKTVTGHQGPAGWRGQPLGGSMGLGILPATGTLKRPVISTFGIASGSSCV